MYYSTVIEGGDILLAESIALNHSKANDEGRSASCLEFIGVIVENEVLEKNLASIIG